MMSSDLFKSRDVTHWLLLSTELSGAIIVPATENSTNVTQLNSLHPPARYQAIRGRRHGDRCAVTCDTRNAPLKNMSLVL